MISLTNTSTEFAVVDGDNDFLAWSAPTTPKTWATEAEAATVARGLTVHPRRTPGGVRVVPVRVERTRWGSTLNVSVLQ